MDDREERLARAIEEHENEEQRKPVKIKISKKVGLILLISGFVAFMILQYGVKGLTPGAIFDAMRGGL